MSNESSWGSESLRDFAALGERASVRILVVDDHEVVRRGVVALLSSQTDYEVCGEAIDGHDAVEKALELQPDVIVMDISMPNLNGLEATRLIRHRLPHSEVLVLSQHESGEMVRQAFNAGARGYVVKSSIARDLLKAVDAVGQHEPFVDGLPSGPKKSERHTDAREILRSSAALEQALRESEELYRSTFELAAVGVAHVSAEGKWLRVNRKLCEIVGYTQEELLERSFQEITHPDDLGPDIAQMKDMLAGSTNQYSIEKRYIRKDGTQVWIRLSVSAVRDSNQKLKHFISVIEEIGARKEAEESRALLATYEKDRFRLAAIVESSDDPIISKDLNGIITSWNSAAERVFGYKSEEIVGKSIMTIIPPELHHEEDFILGRLRKGERIGQFETIRLTKNGRRLDVSLSISPVRNSQGKIVGASKIAHDITERKRAEAALRESEDRFRTMADTAPVLICVSDREGNCTFFNRPWLEFTGRSLEQELGMGWGDDIHPDDKSQALDTYRSSLVTRKPYTMEYRLKRADGQYRWVLYHSVPRYTGKDELAGFVAIGTDTTERKEAESALRASHADLEQRVRERTAELIEKNNNLIMQASVIRDLSRRLLQIQDQERHRIAREMHDSVGQLLAAMSMNFAQVLPESPKLSPSASKALFDNAELLEHTTREVRTLSHLLHPPLLDEAGIGSALRMFVDGFTQRSNIAVNLELPSDVARLPNEIELTIFRMVQESLTNIHRHADSRTASIRLSFHDDQVQLEISDAGKGIPEDKMALLNSSRGTGVGIRGMRERLHQLGGDLEIESTSQGTRLRATVPVTQMAAATDLA